VVGVAAAVSVVAPTLPHDQPLVLRLSGGAKVDRIEGSLTREGEREPARGFSLRFEDSAPSRVLHTVSLPNGRYRLELSVSQRGQPTETRVERRVTLAGEELVIPVSLEQ
jgi:hypothetical protein